VNTAAQAPGIGDFTITIGDHGVLGNPINDLPRDGFELPDENSGSTDNTYCRATVIVPDGVLFGSFNG
jgi:hypothetical protein